MSIQRFTGAGAHDWGTFPATTVLPSTAAGEVGDGLRIGDTAQVGSRRYICTSPTAGSATWAAIGHDGAVLTPGSGGIAPAATATYLYNVPLGGTALASIGTDAAGVAGTIYVSEIVVPVNRSVTHMAALNGTTVGTDAVIYALWTNAGTLITTTALAGTTSAGADVFQEIALLATASLIGPGRYWGGIQLNGTTATHQRMSVNTPLCFTAAIAGVFGTIGDITPPSAFTAGQGPFLRVR